MNRKGLSMHPMSMKLKSSKLFFCRKYFLVVSHLSRFVKEQLTLLFPSRRSSAGPGGDSQLCVFITCAPLHTDGSTRTAG